MMNIRKAKIDDMEQIANILRQVSKLHSEHRPDIFKEKKMFEIIKWTEDILKDDEKIVIIAESENKICGVAVCKIKIIKEHVNVKDSKIFSIDELCVDENYRKKGIGSMLIQKAKETARKNECSRLELNCWEFNKNAMDFYLKRGFKIQRRFLEMDILAE